VACHKNNLLILDVDILMSLKEIAILNVVLVLPQRSFSIAGKVGIPVA